MKRKFTKIVLSGIVALLLLTTILPTSAYSNDMQKQTTTTQEIKETMETSATEAGWYNKPASYAVLISWYQALEAQYPDYLEVFKANELYGTGIIPNGYDDYYIRITNESLGLHKPEVLFLGGPHGDETVGTIGLYWFTDWLMRMAFTDEPSPYYAKDWLRWLIDNREIYIEASHNPYGFDHVQRYDSHGWDLNREADMNWDPYEPTGGIWASVNGQTLVAFLDNHTIRLGADFHGGARLLLYPWGDTHSSVVGVSPITGYSYTYAPPDFYFFDASSLRLGDYMGDYGGNLDKYDIGTIPQTVGYTVGGGLGPWAYGADVETNPVEDPYVQDEVFGNYYGAGVLWLSPEMSNTKNPNQDSFGNDTVARYGAEVRRVVLHQTDLAQPYLRYVSETPENGQIILTNTPVNISWQVNGSMVVDHTYLQYGNNPNPIQTWTYTTPDYDEHDGDYIGGTGWDDAMDGHTSGTTYVEQLTFTTPGEYYFVARAQVDQIYKDVLRPDVYLTNPYLRLIKERTNDSYHEVLEGSDGIEELNGQTWWYSPILHIIVMPENEAPNTPDRPTGPAKGKPGVTYIYRTTTLDPEGDQVYYMWDWGDGNISDWTGPFNSGSVGSASKSYSAKGEYSIKVKAKDVWGAETDWSDPLAITMPKDASYPITNLIQQLLEHLLERFPNAFPILRQLIGQ
jgi:hypothetical protein